MDTLNLFSFGIILFVFVWSFDSKARVVFCKFFENNFKFFGVDLLRNSTLGLTALFWQELIILGFAD